MSVPLASAVGATPDASTRACRSSAQNVERALMTAAAASFFCPAQ